MSDDEPDCDFEVLERRWRTPIESDFSIASIYNQNFTIRDRNKLNYQILCGFRTNSKADKLKRQGEKNKVFILLGWLILLYNNMTLITVNLRKQLI